MKRLFLVGAAALALGAGTAQLVRRPATATRRRPADATGGGKGSPDRTARITRKSLMYFIVPLWIGAGIADWVCHRRSDIEHTAGPKESLIHLAMLTEVGIPTLAGLFLEITAPVFALMIAAFLLHEATALWDVSYAVRRREVTPAEQHVHSFLELLPLMVLSFLAVLHPDQLAGLFGIGDRPADFRLQAKRQPLPTRYVAADLAAIALFNALPYGEELWRTLRVRAQQGRGGATTETRSKSLIARAPGKNRPASPATTAGS